MVNTSDLANALTRYWLLILLLAAMAAFVAYQQIVASCAIPNPAASHVTQHQHRKTTIMSRKTTISNQHVCCQHVSCQSLVWHTRD